MPAEFTLAADKMEDTQEFTLPTGTTEARWVRAVDLLPGTPSIVRSADDLREGARARPSAATAAPAPEHVLAHWLPGQDPEPIDGGAAFRLPAGAQIGVAHPLQEDVAVRRQAARPIAAPSASTSRRTGNAQELLTLPIDVAARAGGATRIRPSRFSRTLDEDVQALALSPDKVPANITLQVEAVRPDGSRVPMIRLNTRADWDRRYWFEKPLTLPRGTRVEVTANLAGSGHALGGVHSTPGAAPPPARALVDAR